MMLLQLGLDMGLQLLLGLWIVWKFSTLILLSRGDIDVIAGVNVSFRSVHARSSR
jgi:hypothetical protein